MEKLFYLAKVFDGLNTVGTVFLVITAILLCFLIPMKYYCYDEDDNEWSTMSKWIRRCWTVLIISLTFVIFIPDKKTFLFMVGGKAVDTLVEKTDIEEIPGNTIDLLNEYIKVETENVKNKHTNSE